jgi:UDP-4-amino-4,6-dideoxy-N-acetyl-beta-L-altrosamine N-acetyltransferase
MHISNYGVDLKSITVADLELIRQWRNHPDVSKYMFFKDEITKDQQRKWHTSLRLNDVYLLIFSERKKIGVINVKNINWEERSGEAGIFIGDPHFRNSPVPMQAIFALMDAFFFEFHFKRLTAVVKRSNDKALLFNQELGYQIISETEDKISMEVTPEVYSLAREKFASFLAKRSVSLPKTKLKDSESSLFRISPDL